MNVRKCGNETGLKKRCKADKNNSKSECIALCIERIKNPDIEKSAEPKSSIEVTSNKISKCKTKNTDDK